MKEDTSQKYILVNRRAMTLADDRRRREKYELLVSTHSRGASVIPAASEALEISTGESWAFFCIFFY